MAKNGLLDKLSEEDRRKVAGWAERAKKPKYDTDIPPELFIGAKLGYYYGWEAYMTYRRGYSVGLSDEGKLIKLPYTFDDAVADVMSAEKVHYKQAVNTSDLIASANISCRSKDYAMGAVKFANAMKKEVENV